MKDPEKGRAGILYVYSKKKIPHKERTPAAGKKKKENHNRRYSSASVPGIARGQVADCRCGDRTPNPLPSESDSPWRSLGRCFRDVCESFLLTRRISPSTKLYKSSKLLHLSQSLSCQQKFLANWIRARRSLSDFTFSFLNACCNSSTGDISPLNDSILETISFCSPRASLIRRRRCVQCGRLRSVGLSIGPFLAV